MHIFHDQTGGILWTADFSPSARIPDQPFIVVDEAPADLTRFRVEDGALVELETITDEARTKAIAEVNRLRGEARSHWITVLPGQDMVYLDKERAALAYLADQEPDPEDYPGLSAEVGITGETLYEVAQVVVNLAYLWRHVSAGIEGICLGAIAEIEATAIFAEADGAVEAAREALEVV